MDVEAPARMPAAVRISTDVSVMLCVAHGTQDKALPVQSIVVRLPPEPAAETLLTQAGQ